MKKKLALLVLLSGILFPLNWLRDQSAFIRQHFDDLFAPEWVHIAMHLLLFAALAFLLARTFRLPPTNPQTALLLAAAILLTGGVQELLQLAAKGRAFGVWEVFDLGVDLAGGTLGWLAYRWREKGSSLHPF